MVGRAFSHAFIHMKSWSIAALLEHTPENGIRSDETEEGEEEHNADKSAAGAKEGRDLALLSEGLETSKVEWVHGNVVSDFGEEVREE